MVSNAIGRMPFFGLDNSHEPFFGRELFLEGPISRNVAIFRNTSITGQVFFIAVQGDESAQEAESHVSKDQNKGAGDRFKDLTQFGKTVGIRN